MALMSVENPESPEHFADSQGLTELCITPKSTQSPSDSDMTPDLPQHHFFFIPNGTSRSVATESDEAAAAIVSGHKEAGIVWIRPTALSQVLASTSWVREGVRQPREAAVTPRCSLPA